MFRTVALGGAALIMTALATPGALAETAGVKVGVLECDVAGGASFIFGSSKDLSCTYSPNKGPEDYYAGSIDKYGLDIGYTEKSTIVWTVFAPTSDIGQGALAGDYGGATAGAAIGVGLGANVLVGGFDKSIALQPLSVEGQEGLNVAVAVAALKLEPMAKKPR